MRSLKDYVNTIAIGMGRFLSDDQLTFLAKDLAKDEQYKEVLSRLEAKIKLFEKDH